jgi:hypothetical protein
MNYIPGPFDQPYRLDLGRPAETLTASQPETLSQDKRNT